MPNSTSWTDRTWHRLLRTPARPLRDPLGLGMETESLIRETSTNRTIYSTFPCSNAHRKLREEGLTPDILADI